MNESSYFLKSPKLVKISKSSSFQWINKRMNKWMNDWTNKWLSEWIDGFSYLTKSSKFIQNSPSCSRLRPRESFSSSDSAFHSSEPISIHNCLCEYTIHHVNTQFTMWIHSSLLEYTLHCMDTQFSWECILHYVKA